MNHCSRSGAVTSEESLTAVCPAESTGRDASLMQSEQYAPLLLDGPGYHDASLNACSELKPSVRRTSDDGSARALPYSTLQRSTATAS